MGSVRNVYQWMIHETIRYARVQLAPEADDAAGGEGGAGTDVKPDAICRLRAHWEARLLARLQALDGGGADEQPAVACA